MALLFGDLDFSAAEIQAERARLQSLGIKTVFDRTKEEVQGHYITGPDGINYPVFVCPANSTDPTKPLIALVDNHFDCVHGAMKYAASIPKLLEEYNICAFITGMGVKTETLFECIVKAGVTIVVMDKPQYVHDDCPACNEAASLAYMLQEVNIRAIIGQTYIQADVCSLAFQAAIRSLVAA